MEKNRPYIICHMVESIDGRHGLEAMFDDIADQTKVPAPLSLQSVERLPNDVLWIRYTLFTRI